MGEVSGYSKKKTEACRANPDGGNTGHTVRGKTIQDKNLQFEQGPGSRRGRKKRVVPQRGGAREQTVVGLAWQERGQRCAPYRVAKTSGCKKKMRNVTTNERVFSVNNPAEKGQP